MKLTIIHTSGSKAGTQRSISGKAAIRLGRHPDNDLVFDAADDVAVSAFHAEIRISEQRAVLVDAGSTNGTFVNGRQIKDHQLMPSDVVQFGPQGSGFRVEYAAPTLQPTPGSAADKAAAAQAPDTDVMAAPPAQQQAPAAAQPASGKQYGQRTVGVMIQQALAQAGLMKQPGTSKSTEYFEALVDKKVKTKTSKMKWVIIISIVVVVIAGSIFGIWIWRNRSVQVLQQVNYGDAAGSSIAANNRYAVFMLAGAPRSNPRGELQGFCTGFAISPDLLATNSHCVLAAQSKFSNVYALMNGVRKSRYQVTQMVAHPAYTPKSISPDVALMRVNTRLEHLVTMAGPAELAQIAPGAPMFLYGFPGRLNKEEAPEATFIKGDIGRVTTFDQELGDFGHNTLLQHSAYSSGGTSGSPMFNSAGQVIGVNAGGYVEGGEVLHGYNFGMRIDLLHALYGQMERAVDAGRPAVRHLGSVLWLVPLAAQIGYILATYDELPAAVGAGPDGPGTDVILFVVEWFAIVGVANLAFAAIHVKLPKLGDRMLAVPGREYWHETPERREILVDRLRGICEITLLLLNVFFLAVYQNIYQTNVTAPVIAIGGSILIPFFMVLPLVVVVVTILVVMRNLAAEARRAAIPPVDLPMNGKGR